MKPTDRAWLASVKAAYIPYDTAGNALRMTWLRQVEADSAGCWIWNGEVTGGGYPSFRAQYLGGEKHWAPFRWFLVLWSPKTLLNAGPYLMRYRLCGKRLCVRPACATTRRNAVHPLVGEPAKRYRADLDRASLVADYAAGVRTGEIRRRYGVSKATVWRLITDAGVTPQTPGPAPTNLGEARAMWEAGAANKDISAKLGITRGHLATARQRAKKKGNPWVR